MATPGRGPAQTPYAYRGARETGQAPCYAVVRTVSPVRVHSSVRYIPAPRIGRARLSVEPNAMKPALRIWSPVRLLGPAYMVPALRSVSPVRLHSPVRAIPPRRNGRATESIQPGKVGQARCSKASVHLHGPVYPMPPPRTSPPVTGPRTRLPVRVLGPVPPVPAPHTRPTVRLACPALP